LSRLEKNLDVVANCPLRFIRSCSAALPENIMHKLEQKIQVPVIESYGMTEAAHQMASNPMPPARRKPGSVGVAAGPEIAIMNEQGDLMPQGEVGEVVIRGPNVTGGYENNSEANQQSFTKGWFRTGDQGWLDEEGYLFLKGRLKEIINRGGEKISPREIDEVLMTHEAVGQAVAFAVPHEKLGEELAAAVTLKAGASLIESELQQFVASKLVDFKIPRQILFLKDIPKGPTGKLQRIGLAQRLGLTQQIKEKKSEKPGYQPPRTLSEKTLAKIWIDVLGIKRVGIYDEFLDLGGDSILAVLLFTEVEKRFGRKLLMSTLFQASTVAQQANLLDKNEMDLSFRSLVTLRARGSEFPLFLVHPLTGGVAGFYSLVRHMQSEGPICAFQAQGIDGTLPPLGSVEAMAQRYLVELCEVQPHGPYFLAGHSFGGMICFEMARQLSLKGEKIAFLGLLDAQATDYPKSEPRDLNESLHRKFEIVNYHLSHLMELEWQGKWRYIWRRVRNRLSRLQDPPHMELILSAHAKAKRDYKPKNYKDRAVLFRNSIEVPGLKAPRDWGWSDWILGGLKIFDVRGCHLTSVEEYPRTLAKTLDRVLSEARNQARNLSRSDFRRS
jgi:thioesterase domain-containing protein/acyl carrier protein